MATWQPGSKILSALVFLALAVAALGWQLSQHTAAQPKAAPASSLERAVVCWGRVDLPEGCARLAPLQPGRVARVPVREGDHVEAEQALLVLEDDSAQLRVEEARQVLAGAQARLTQARILPDRHRLRLRAQQAAVIAAQERVAALRHTLERRKELQRDKLTSSLEVAVVEDQLREQEAFLDAEQQKLSDERLQQPEQELQQAEAEVKRAAAVLRQAERTLAECTLKAPSAGVVLRLLVCAGDVLTGPNQQSVILFAPDGPRIIRAEVEQESAALVQADQTVRIQDDYTDQPLGQGRIKRLSGWYLPRRINSLEPTRSSEGRTLECIVELEPGHPPLRLGQQVRVLFGGEGP